MHFTELAIPKIEQSGTVLSFFVDFPIFGYRAKVRRHLVRMLRKRDEDEEFRDAYIVYWRSVIDNDDYLAIVDRICRLIEAEYCWGTISFLPNDSMLLLTWMRCDNMEDVSLSMSIKREFSVDLDGLVGWKQVSLSDLCTYVYVNRSRA